MSLRSKKRRAAARKAAMLHRAALLADEIENRTYAFKHKELDFAAFNRMQRETWSRVHGDRDPRVLLAVNRILNDW